jgi:hypothetical protein
MAFKDKAGKNFNSKFRSNRSDRENAVSEGMDQAKPKGNRAQANAIKAKGTKSKPMATGAGDDGGPVNAAVQRWVRKLRKFISLMITSMVSTMFPRRWKTERPR